MMQLLFYMYLTATTYSLQFKQYIYDLYATSC